THNAWASQLTQSGTTIGVEFATPSVTSPGLELYAGFGSDEALQASFESAITTLIDDLEYLNAGQRGFILVTFTAEKASCDWVFVDTIASSSYNVTTGKRMQVLAGSELTLESVDDLG
ncbi:alkaline phosphatase D family protein, partial [Wenyingzhuangia sp. 1_MG-2023]|nr:alkaline phosphatase D family protein [Wenyingzhuangia sp. 1_MG-2023]